MEISWRDFKGTAIRTRPAVVVTAKRPERTQGDKAHQVCIPAECVPGESERGTTDKRERESVDDPRLHPLLSDKIVHEARTRGETATEMSNTGNTSRRRLAGPSSRASRQQWSAFPQTKQRHADVQGRNQQLQSDNLELRSQNSDLARQLNDVRVKFQALQQQKRDLERRLAQIEAINRRDKAQAREAVSATPTPPPPSPVGLKGSQGGIKAPTPVYRPAAILASPVSPSSGQGRWEPQSCEEGVLWIEDQSPERVHARRGRRSSILPSTTIPDDHLRRGRQSQHQRQHQRPASSPPSTSIQPQSPSPRERVASWSLAGDGESGSDRGSSRDTPSPGERSGSGGSSGGGNASQSLGRSSWGVGGRPASRSLELPVGGDMGGASRSLELSSDGGDGERQASLFASAATPASPTVLLTLPSEGIPSPDGDGGHGPHHDSGNANSPPPAAGQQLRLGRVAGALGWQQQRSRSELATEPAPVRASAAAGNISAATDTSSDTAGRRTERGFLHPSLPGSPEQMPGRSRSFSSTPIPSSSSLEPSSSDRLRPRRNVARPVSYQEPSLNIKMRKGHVMFPKEHRSSDGEISSLSETAPVEEKENQR